MSSLPGVIVLFGLVAYVVIMCRNHLRRVADTPAHVCRPTVVQDGVVNMCKCGKAVR